MTDGNFGILAPVFRRVGLGGLPDRLLRDRGQVAFVNQTLRSRDRMFEVEFTGKMADVPRWKLAASPHGLYQVLVTLDRHCHKSFFINVRSGRGIRRLDTDFFIQADKAKPRFPSFATLQGEDWKDLARVFKNSGIDRDAYDSIPDLPKGTLFNLHAKAQAEELASGTVFTHVDRIVRMQRERTFFRVRPKLLDRVSEGTAFREADGTLHKGFSNGFKRVASFKTRESMGNLQLTFAKNSANEMELDADLDDHQGILHAFDVIRHNLTGDKTHPFHIHQILRRFHNIHAGYTLS